MTARLVRVPGGARAIDGTGKWVTPGFIDSVIRDGRVVDLAALPYQRIFSKEGRGHAW